jgi:hypothetical protein
MKRKSSYIGALGVAVMLALPATASAQKSPQSWCPSAARADCGKVGKRPTLAPGQIRPKIRPALVRGPYGGEAWQSGSWQMS